MKEKEAQVLPVVSIAQARWLFVLVLLVTGAIKLWMGAKLPIVGDEAFFDQWAYHPDWGFYDHPPMIGWWLWVLHRFGDTPLVIRSATMLLTSVVACGVVFLARRLLPTADESRAWLAGAVYLSLPVSWFAVLVTTDTPLIFFMGLSIAFYVMGVRRDSSGRIFAAGVFLGLAFLSKYFAVLLGVAYAVHLVFFHRKNWLWLLWLVLGALPFVAENLIYNATHCWNNIMFNLINRNADAHWGWENTALFLIMMVGVVSPWALWRLVCHRSGWFGHRALSLLFLVPMFLFFVLSLKKTIGLHWVLGFVPVAFVMLALCTPAWVLRRFVMWNTVYSLVPLSLLAAVLYLNPSVWTNAAWQENVRFHRYAPEIMQGLTSDLPQDAVLTTLAYSPASVMTYYSGRYVPVFGPGKYHARNDDVFVDWRQMAGKPIRIVSKGKPIDPAVYSAYLSDIRVTTRELEGVLFYVVDGTQFNYSLFRDVVLREAVTRYYQIPKALPVLACPFGEKYGFEAECRVGDWGALKRFAQ